MSAYGVDVLDPGVSVRRVWVLANRLPPWAQAPGEPWSAESHLLALLVDHIAQLTWVTLRVSGSRDAPRPQPLPRPSPALARAPATRPGSQATSPEAGPGGWAAAAQVLAAMPGAVVVDG